GGFWEFPGGKRETGESLEECLHRELKEELGIDITPGSPFHIIRHEYPEKLVELHFFCCTIHSGAPQILGCEEWRWVAPKDLSNYEFPPADRSIIEMLQRAPGTTEKGMQFPLDAKLKDSSPIQFVLANARDIEPLRRL